VTKPIAGKLRGRPPSDFFSYPVKVRMQLAQYGAFLLEGHSNRRAALLVMAGENVWQLGPLHPEEIRDLNRKLKLGGKRRRWPENSWVVHGREFRWDYIRGRVRTIQTRYDRSLKEPLAAHWLRIMARSLSILQEADPIDARAARGRAEWAIALGVKVEADLMAMLSPD
jgi:hypothetical protein